MQTTRMSCSPCRGVFGVYIPKSIEEASSPVFPRRGTCPTQRTYNLLQAISLSKIALGAIPEFPYFSIQRISLLPPISLVDIFATDRVQQLCRRHMAVYQNYANAVIYGNLFLHQFQIFYRPSIFIILFYFIFFLFLISLFLRIGIRLRKKEREKYLYFDAFLVNFLNQLINLSLSLSLYLARYFCTYLG